MGSRLSKLQETGELVLIVHEHLESTVIVDIPKRRAARCVPFSQRPTSFF